ncbi:unnamed protein product, partial [Rotaria magnacalcarata]
MSYLNKIPKQINLFRRRLADLEDEDRRYKAEARRLQAEMSKLQ